MNMQHPSKLSAKGKAFCQALIGWHDALARQVEADAAEEAAHERLSVFVDEYRQAKIAARIQKIHAKEHPIFSRDQLELKLEEARQLLAIGKSADDVYTQLMMKEAPLSNGSEKPSKKNTPQGASPNPSTEQKRQESNDFGQAFCDALNKGVMEGVETN